MAKLTNVETIDMVNGEITKVAYDGVEYVLTTQDGDKGDIGLVVDAWGNQNVGEYFVIKSTDGDSGRERILRIAGNTCGASCYAYRMKIFRKIAVQTPPTLEARVTELETEVAALKGEKANETIEFEGAEYRKVDREAREGDVVIFRENKSRSVNNSTPYLVGSLNISLKRDNYVLAVKGTCNCRVYSEVYNRNLKNVDVYEPTEQAKPYSPKVGDVVVITATGSHCFSVGDIVKIVDDIERGRNPYRGEYADKTTPIGNYLCDFEVRPATPSEIEAYEKALHKASFAVGDYVKVVKSHVGKVGVVLQITDISDDIKMRLPSGGIVSADFRGTLLSDGETYGFTADQLVKATDAEIAKATAPKLKAGDFVKITRKLSHYDNDKAYEIVEGENGRLGIIDEDGDYNGGAIRAGEYEIVSPEEVKWAKLGRKVGELKQGDVVRVKDACGAPGFNRGQITEVSAKSTTVSAKVGTGWLVCAELVAPVESLVS